MPVHLSVVSPGSEIDALGRAIERGKGGNALEPVTVVVPTNVSGVMARRALGRQGGVIGIDIITINRLAELLAGPELAVHRRRPVSDPVLDATIRKVLGEAPGAFASVADHPATIDALRRLHRELRLAGDDAAQRLAQRRRGREIVRISSAVTRILQRQWYDDADLLTVAAEQLDHGVPDGLRQVVVHLPGHLDPLAVDFLHRLGDRAQVSVIASLTGDADADLASVDTLGALGFHPPFEPIDAASTSGLAVGSTSEPAPGRPRRVLSTTDADDEVAHAVRAIIDAARGELLGRPVSFDRIAVLWPVHRPYARLVEHHLDAAGIDWNGRGGTELIERQVPRLLLEVLDVDRRGLRRRVLFDLLADVAPRDGDGRTLGSVSEWERVSRAAGVSGDDDWVPRLAALAAAPRWTSSATSLSAFVSELRTRLGDRWTTRTWSEWVDWSVDLLDWWLGRGAHRRLPDADYTAWETTMAVLDRLRALDVVDAPATRPHFRAVLERELAASTDTTGRVGDGVTVGSLGAADGLDIDLAIVLGCADGLLPPLPTSDALLGDDDRRHAGLASAQLASSRLQHAFRSVVASVDTVITMPRGDLRSATVHQPSRMLSSMGVDRIEHAPSHAAGLSATAFAPSERERRLGDLLRTVEAGRAIDELTDQALAPRLAMHRARAGDRLSIYDGDLSASGVPLLGSEAVSPTRIETWASCPHAYFVRYLLGVQPVEEPDADIAITRSESGSLQHQVLDRFHRDVLDGRLAQPNEHGWIEAHRIALLGHFDDVCAEHRRQGRVGRPATWAGRRLRMRDDLLGWLERDGEIAAARGAIVLDSEHHFPRLDEHARDDRDERDGDEGDGEASDDRDAPDRAQGAAGDVWLPLPDGRRLPIRGSVDRLDRCADGLIVITDHKTGRPDPYRKLCADDPTLAATKFQLPAYAAAALARFGAAPGTTASAARVRSEYSMFSQGDYQRFGFELTTNVWERVRDDLARIVDGIEAGWYPNLPDKPAGRASLTCRYCDPDRLGTDRVWERWARKRHDERVLRWFGDDPAEAPLDAASQDGSDDD